MTYPKGRVLSEDRKKHILCVYQSVEIRATGTR